jgi:hypothetical protein
MGTLISADQTLIDQQIKSERETDFDSNSAYGEIIDNSIQANSNNIKIIFDYKVSRNSEKLNFVAFGDDGEGMDSDIIEKCLTSGFSTRYNDREGIGRFGVGMTKAFLNQCLVCKIYSKKKSGVWNYTFADISPENKNKNEIPKAIQKNPPEELINLSGKDSGTLIIWEKHDKQDSNATTIIEDFRIWSGRVYRKFIDNGLKILINSSLVKTIDPTFLNPKNSTYPEDPSGELIKEFTISWPVDKEKQTKPDQHEDIIIKVSLAPLELRKVSGDQARSAHPDTPKYKKMMQERNINEDFQGILIMRNDREVFFGIPYPWKGLKFEPLMRWIGIEINFKAHHDKWFTVKNIKVGAKPALLLKETISDMIRPTVNNLLNRIKEDQESELSKYISEQKEAGILSGHEEAENIAKNQTRTKSNLTKNKEEEELREKAINERLDDEQKRLSRAAWEAKFKNQPFTILDSEWKGPDFMQISHTKTGAVMSYNLSHPLHKIISRTAINMMKENPDIDLLKKEAKQLKTLIDLILMCYLEAEHRVDPEQEIVNVEDFLEDLRANWSNFLKRYLRDLDNIDDSQKH